MWIAKLVRIEQIDYDQEDRIAVSSPQVILDRCWEQARIQVVQRLNSEFDARSLFAGGF